MAETIHLMQGQELYAVASRSKERADAFAKEMGASHAYGSYQELANDQNVDLVYVATIHTEHFNNIMMCLQAGRNVLCEKAFTLNAREAKLACRLSEQRRLLLAEAMWPRYMPSRELITGLIKQGAIGDIRMLTANLCYRISDVPRIKERSMGGGALLDVGVYPLSFMLTYLGSDYVKMQSIASVTALGVDEQNATTFIYSDGRIGVIQSGTKVRSDRRGMIYGTKGTIEVENVNNPEMIRLLDQDGKVIREIASPKQLTGYEYEIEACQRAIAEGKFECHEMPHRYSIKKMEIIDAIRRSWGFRSPTEK
jgi:predicted dehydrogenase